MWIPGPGNTILRCGRNPGMSAGETAIRAGNTVAWYDFTDASTLTNDGGGLISSWRDKLLSGHDLVAATTARPTLGATGIVFNGTSNTMKTAPFTYAQPEMIYMVLRQVTWSGVAFITDGNADSTMVFCQITTTPNLALYAGSVVANNTDLVVNTFGIARVLFNTTSSKLIINNGTPTTGNPGAADAGAITIGSVATGGTYFCNVEIKEAVFRNIADTPTTETAIYNYLAAKYGYATI